MPYAHTLTHSILIPHTLTHTIAIATSLALIFPLAGFGSSDKNLNLTIFTGFFKFQMVYMKEWKQLKNLLSHRIL